jgi:ZIP family zinc transporter
MLENNGALALAFTVTLFAGLSTGIGSAIAFFARRTNTKILSVALGFSAGVMIYISFVEIFFKGQELLVEVHGEKWGKVYNVMAFFLGIFIIAIIDRFVPDPENPHEDMKVEDLNDRAKKQHYFKLYRTGLVTALAIAIHNFPEGLATFFSTLNDPQMGIPIAVAIAIHNIPEGIAVSVPIYYATGSKKKAFFYSFISGLSEPIGAIVGYFILSQFMGQTLFGFVFTGIAGVMVFISLDQLLPAAREYGEHHYSIYGLIAGMGVMALSLIMFL